jgi:sRNA-binding protein
MEGNMEGTTNTSGIEKLATALAKAQAKFKNPPKNRTVKVQHKAGGSHSYSYATLDEVLDGVRGPLSENGIAFLQLVTVRDGMNVLVTQLIHESGQMIESVYKLPEGLGSQEYGAAITYARRYSACPMLGIAGETDTDGEQLEAAEEKAAEEKKAVAFEKLKQAATEGRLTDANTGKKIASAEIEKKKEEKKEEKPEDNIPMDNIDKALQAKLDESKITLSQFKTWGVKKGNWPEEMDMTKLEKGFITVILKNWVKVIEAIKGDK